ncbi:hypothetical protein [Mesorhizobium sp. WSM4313]|uniref:hypothetical protein n=1 Tax=Mesorhizobium sp. WSM4313 TaxID=2029412 RepID=UPI001596F01E|nr:hypothetical protein [Mesorhizobium sp. WSM4313]
MKALIIVSPFWFIVNVVEPKWFVNSARREAERRRSDLKNLGIDPAAFDRIGRF